MTNRVKGITIVLEKDIREDDVESLLQAIRHFRGVLSAEPVIATTDSYFAYARIVDEMRGKLYEMAKNLGSPQV